MPQLSHQCNIPLQVCQVWWIWKIHFLLVLLVCCLKLHLSLHFLFLLFLLGKGFEQTTLDAVQASCTLFSSSDSALFVLDYINIVLGSKCEHLWLCKAHPGDHVEHGSIWIVGTCIFCTYIEAFHVLVLEPACDLLVERHDQWNLIPSWVNNMTYPDSLLQIILLFLIHEHLHLEFFWAALVFIWPMSFYIWGFIVDVS